MVISKAFFDLKKLKNFADWKLLLFLILFLNVKLAVKVPAVIIIYLLQFNFKFGFRFKDSRLPLFYLLVIGVALANWLIYRNFTRTHYNLVLLTGVGFWVMCILALHQVKLSVEHSDVETIHRTIVIFFTLNAVLSFLTLAGIMIETGAINPFTYQGMYQKYFLGTGDYIRGLTFDTSTTNAVLNAFGVIYFLTKKNTVMLLLCMAVMLLTGSNYTNILLLLILALLFVFRSGRDQKSLITVCLMMLVIFMAKISPQNDTYVVENLKKDLQFKSPEKGTLPSRPRLNLPVTLMPDSLLGPEEKRSKIAQKYIDSLYVINHPVLSKSPGIQPPAKTPPVTDYGRVYIPKADINTQPYQHLIDTSAYQRQLLSFIAVHKASLPISGQNNVQFGMPGKINAWLQTLNFFRQHPFRLITGAGMGNFSSKLAFRASGLGFAGGYPQKYIYIHPSFLSNHLDIYLNFFSKKTDVHSLVNNPDSVYDQLLAEYGLLGLAAFLIYYLGFFLRHHQQLTYGLPILLLLLGAFFIEYWFEQLSVLLFFELLLILNIKETSGQKIGSYAN